jgi:hypothetical protein
MGLKDTIKNAAKAAIQATGDLALGVDYTRVVPGAYDPTTDSTTNVTTTFSDVPAVNVRLTEREVEWFPADVVTQKLLIAAADLSIVPSVNDIVTIDGAVWQVQKVNRVPGDSLWIVFIQEP